MSEKQDRVLRALETAGISYTLTEHPAVHTIEEMDVLPLPYPEAVLKNLLDRKSTRLNSSHMA